VIDPKALHFAIRAGRALGWQRVVPLLLLGFLGLQWAQDARKHGRDSGGI
jgi:hypothetical protein